MAQQWSSRIKVEGIITAPSWWGPQAEVLCLRFAHLYSCSIRVNIPDLPRGTDFKYGTNVHLGHEELIRVDGQCVKGQGYRDHVRDPFLSVMYLRGNLTTSGTSVHSQIVKDVIQDKHAREVH